MNESKTSLKHAPGALDPSCLLTFFIDDFKIGDTFTDWPRHITIIPWFFVHDIERTDADMQSIAAQYHLLEIRGNNITHFSELEVCLVEPKDALREVHKAIYESLQSNNAQFIDTTYFGDNYNPHVTMQTSGGLLPGDVVKLSSFYLVKRYRETDSERYIKTIVREYVLNG